jgi:hypothetical protein
VSSEIARRYKFILIIAAIYLVAHVAFLAPSLEDIDSINFALGLRHYDVAQHQPHPPGYPVYIALGRMAKTALEAIGPSPGSPRMESLSLAIWSPIAGAVALIAAYSIFAAVSTSSMALWATALLAASPLFWLTGSRPMSDMPGLALALVAQALFLRGTTDRRAIVIGAVIAGIAAGIRVQTACLRSVHSTPRGRVVDRDQTRCRYGYWWVRLGDPAHRSIGWPRRLSRRVGLTGG